MSDANPPAGSIVWRDLTVPDARVIRDFYGQVVGWDSTPHDMGDYDDYNILPQGSDRAVAGICHARGSNADLPAQWLIYVTVEDVEAWPERIAAVTAEQVKAAAAHVFRPEQSVTGRLVPAPQQTTSPISRTAQLWS